tara:strand:- start:40 stop:264 length:225 start_codon:yes stop_codon:yes gene_type:complete
MRSIAQSALRVGAALNSLAPRVQSSATARKSRVRHRISGIAAKDRLAGGGAHQFERCKAAVQQKTNLLTARASI